jgi:hypothetical protein
MPSFTWISGCTSAPAMLQRNSFVVLALGFFGCSDNKIPEVTPDLAIAYDLTMGPDLAFPARDPSSHPALPLVDNGGGMVLAAPEIWTVVWPGDEALGAKVNEFMGWMLTSDYWTTSLGEYGVGAGIAKGVIVMPSAPPATIDDKDFKTHVKTVISLLPEPTNANTDISFIIPVSIKSTMQGGQGCTDYGGYHSQTRTASGATASVPYMVNLQCHYGSTPLFDVLTEVLSHEAAESSSDPLPFSSPAWDNQSILIGGEIGDLCVDLTTTFNVDVTDADAGTSHEAYVVQRLYSQKIAAAGGKVDPCLPAPSTPYFNVGLDPSDSNITVDATSGMGSVEIKVEPFAMGAVGPIKWTIFPIGTGVNADPDSGENSAGDTIRMNLTANTQAKGNDFPIVLEAELADGTINEWFGSVSVR